MIIAFLQTSEGKIESVTGIDCTGFDGFLYQEEVDKDLDSFTPNLVFDEASELYYIEWSEKEITESQEQKKSRISQLLVTSENYEEIDNEGVTFQKSDCGPMIISRFFQGDRDAEMAYMQKWNYLKDKERTDVEEVELELIRKGYKAKEAFKNFILSLK